MLYNFYLTSKQIPLHYTKKLPNRKLLFAYSVNNFKSCFRFFKPECNLFDTIKTLCKSCDYDDRYEKTNVRNKCQLIFLNILKAFEFILRKIFLVRY